MEDRMYEIGDKVKFGNGLEGIVCEKKEEAYVVYDTTKDFGFCTEEVKDLSPDLHNINKPFGLCGRTVQSALKEAWNGEKEDEDSNIEIYGSVEWFKQEPLWKNPCTYRLAKPEAKKNPEFITIEGAKYQLVEGEE